MFFRKKKEPYNKSDVDGLSSQLDLTFKHIIWYEPIAERCIISMNFDKFPLFRLTMLIVKVFNCVYRHWPIYSIIIIFLSI